MLASSNLTAATNAGTTKKTKRITNDVRDALQEPPPA